MRRDPLVYHYPVSLRRCCLLLVAFGYMVFLDLQAAPSVGLVGKGIVYDTGGLNLKSSGGRGMKGERAIG